VCGIFGVASAQPLTEPRHLLETLTDRLAHRGPDGRGVHAEERVFLGHRRLAVLDPVGGVQPMSTEDGRYVLVYNGELYNLPELRAQLRARGRVFSTRGDTEVVLQAYAEWGADCLSRLRGMFAFAVWDRTRQELFLARDRLGIKPIYYALLGPRLVFASEMKAITGHPEFPRQANLAALSSYLSLRTVIGAETVFTGLHALQPGFFARFAGGRLELRRYWDIPQARAGKDRGERYYLGRLRELLSDTVKRHLVSDVPVGAYLSGGVDSSLLVALMARHAGSPIKTFSIGYDAPGYDEGDYAEIVSRHLGAEHRRLVVEPGGFLDTMEAMILDRDQPLSIPHETALRTLSHDLGSQVTVCMSGEGADELFGGYGRVQRSPHDFQKLKFLEKWAGPAAPWLSGVLGDSDLAPRLGARDDVEHFLHVYHWWPMAEKAALFTPEVRQALNGDEALRASCRSIFDASGSTDAYERVFYFFEKVHLLNLLDRLDVQSMAASVEARVPFVDHELVEFVSAIPLRHKMRWRSPVHMVAALFMKSEDFSEVLDINKYLLRRLADEMLPPAIARRKKLGFPTPLDRWLAGPLRQRAREILLDPMTRRRGLFRTDVLERLLQDEPDLKYDFHGKRVWMLMNVELWFRLHIDARP
jgi:asparagine synthase (glutamine-hydrolysing)